MMQRDVWNGLRKYTPARIALGRAGGSLPSSEVLDFAWAHAEARDAVHARLDVEKLVGEIEVLGVKCLKLQSAAPDRISYVRRPDLGRRLSDRSKAELQKHSRSCDVALIVADGLSATAAHQQSPKLLAALLPMVKSNGLTISPICIVQNGRVAIQDEIGQLLGAKSAVILLGERPGLGTADSLGAYLVFAPKPGKTDADRNCVSNIREAGLPPTAAAGTIHYLLTEALRRKISGVNLKDERVSALNTESAKKISNA